MNNLQRIRHLEFCALFAFCNVRDRDRGMEVSIGQITRSSMLRKIIGRAFRRVNWSGGQPLG